MDVQAISPEWIMQKVAAGKPFTLVLLLAGKKEMPDDDGAKALQLGHLTHLFTMERDGHISIFGPVNNDARLKGIIVFNTTDREQITRLLAEDPAVREGYFTYELLDWFSIPGQTLPS